MKDLLCMTRSTALVIAALVNTSPVFAETQVDDTATPVTDSGSAAGIAEQARLLAAAQKKSLQFRLKVNMDAHPTERFFPDLWPNQNLPMKKKVDQALVNELTEIKASVRIPSSAAVLVPGGASTRP